MTAAFRAGAVAVRVCHSHHSVLLVIAAVPQECAGVGPSSIIFGRVYIADIVGAGKRARQNACRVENAIMPGRSTEPFETGALSTVPLAQRPPVSSCLKLDRFVH